MKVFFAALVAFFVTPAAAFGAASLTMREVPLHGQRALAATAPLRFDLVGLHWRGTGSVEFRTRSVEGSWSAWNRAAPEAEDQPDPRSPERRRTSGWHLGNPYWTGSSDRIDYRLRGPVHRLRAFFVRSPEERIPLRRLSMANSPPVLSRRSWGADESIRRGAPRYATSVAFSIVHHTAGTNSYTAAQSAAIVRGIYVYHARGNGWDDIGYNFLVDRFGNVFEGRYGGVDQNVIGAHAEGFNTGSTGIAVLGTYGSAAPPPVARRALASLLSWRLDVAHIDAVSSLLFTSGGNAKFPTGTPVTLRAVAGHRDTGFTTCPGAALYSQLKSLAQQAASAGLPKLYAPTVEGDMGGQIRFRARLTAELPWTVTVTDAEGAVVASGAGTSRDVDWTWDSATAARGLYGWTIAAGDTVRRATGTVGASPVPLTIRAAAASPRTITPNGDGQTDASVISYTLSAPATVTATLRATDGRQLAVLFSQQRRPGRHSFRFTAAGVADGRYDIVLTATDGIATVVAVVPILVDRTVRRFTVAPPAVSPNGDGVKDELVFSFELTRAARVRLDVAQAGRTVAQVYAADLRPGAQTVSWNSSGAKDGKYAALLTAANELATVTHSASFRVDTLAPRLRVLSWPALRFAVSEPATVRLTVNGRRLTRSVRAGSFAFGIARVKTARIAATDAAGNVSRTLRYR
jgi:N-acetylmuramoyl-L-alanine amidase